MIAKFVGAQLLSAFLGVIAGAYAYATVFYNPVGPTVDFLLSLALSGAVFGAVASVTWLFALTYIVVTGELEP